MEHQANTQPIWMSDTKYGYGAILASDILANVFSGIKPLTLTNADFFLLI